MARKRRYDICWKCPACGTRDHENHLSDCSLRPAETPAMECWTCGVDLDECGSCGAYHHKDYMGDCRDNSERFETDALPVSAKQATNCRAAGHDVRMKGGR